jgi:uncharacterized protein (DUF2141 family)
MRNHTQQMRPPRASKLTRKYPLNVARLFVTAIVGLTAGVALSQVMGPSQLSANPGALDAEGFPSSRSQRNIPGAVPTNLGPLIFLPAVAYDSGGYTASAVAVGDVNGDGKLDIVLGNECANSGCLPGGAAVDVLLGNGDRTFQTAVTYHTGGSSGPFFPVSIAIADVNGDHKPDLVVANGGSNTVAVLLGNGDGTFHPAVSYGSGGMFPVSVAVADVNGDGKLDVIVANECADSNCDGSVGVLLGNGDGTFQSAVPYLSGGLYALSVAITDVNGDGNPDLLVATNYLVCHGGLCTPTGAVGVLLGNGKGTFQSAVIYDSGGSYPYSLVVDDLNGDGKLDVVTANSWSGTMGVLLGNGDGTFQAAVTYGSGDRANVVQISSVAVADVNHDGRPDLLLTTQSAGGDSNNGGAVSVLLGNGDGTFQPAVEYASGGYQTLGVAVGDVNGDGRPDLLIANSCSHNSTDCGGPVNKTRGTVSVLLNNNGAPPTTTSLVSSANPADVKWTVTYTAKVTRQAGGTVKGTVTFSDGFATVATLALAAGQAAYSTSYSTKGTHSITATYSGDLNNAAGSMSAVLTEVIKVPHPSKTVVITSGSPSFVGRPVKFTATVTSTYGAIPDGELTTFYDGPTVLASVALRSGTAAYTTSSLSAKMHTIEARYAGDVNFSPSTGAVVQVVNLYSTKTALTSRPNPSTHGQAVTFTATVTSTGPNLPTGKVAFKDGTTVIGSAVLSRGVATLVKSTLAVGTHPITAEYLGDQASAKSTSAVVSQVVN